MIEVKTVKYVNILWTWALLYAGTGLLSMVNPLQQS